MVIDELRLIRAEMRRPSYVSGFTPPPSRLPNISRNKVQIWATSPSNFKSKIGDGMYLICSEICRQFYILCYIPSRNMEPQSSDISPHFEFRVESIVNELCLICVEMLSILCLMFHTPPHTEKNLLGHFIPSVTIRI